VDLAEPELGTAWLRGERKCSPRKRAACSRQRLSHVAKLQTQQDFHALKRYLKEAYEVSLARPSPAAD
jgi:hypothetical protein